MHIKNLKKIEYLNNTSREVIPDKEQVLREVFAF